MMTLALSALFTLCLLASGLVLADSGMRAVGAWRRLRGELRMVSGECATRLIEVGAPRAARVARLDCQDLMPVALRAAA